jgi:lipoyl(octanoyl) transferase
MDNYRLIYSEPGSGPYNMAVDEAIFTCRAGDKNIPSTLRLFKWEMPQYTIGYFQKYSQFTEKNLPITRRLTGGLGVLHDRDLSYSLVSTVKASLFSQDQEKNYLTLHKILQTALCELGILSEFMPQKNSQAKPSQGADRLSCVKTIFPHDLFHKGKKIAGSSQRKRGETILLQGTLHLDLKGRNKADITDAITKTFKKNFGLDLLPEGLSISESAAAKGLIENKYTTQSWNQKY